MTFRRLLWLSLMLGILSGCSWFTKEEDETKDWTASQFYSTASEHLRNGGYEQAIKYYEKLEARYPFGKYAMQAQLDVAYAYYKYEEPESAIAAADRFIKLNPRNPHVDYAYYLKGLVNFNRNVGFFDRFVPADPSQRDQKAALQSFNDFAELVRRFPDSQYTPDARQRMIFLRNMLAQHEVNVADYYIRRAAYVAAAERAVGVVENYPHTPAVKGALEAMVTAYTHLGLDDLAADAQRVLALNLEKGTFNMAEPKLEEKSWASSIWDYLELDRN